MPRKQPKMPTVVNISGPWATAKRLNLIYEKYIVNTALANINVSVRGEDSSARRPVSLAEASAEDESMVRKIAIINFFIMFLINLSLSISFKTVCH
jgi:hypothetical protein